MTDATWPKNAMIYLHSDKDSNYEIADKIGLSNKASDNFRYCCSEIAIKLEINEDGTYKILGLVE